MMVADLWPLMLPSESSWKKQMGAIISFISMYYILINMMMIPECIVLFLLFRKNAYTLLQVFLLAIISN